MTCATPGIIDQRRASIIKDASKSDVVGIRALSDHVDLERVSGGIWKKNGLPWYTPPTVIMNDGINVLTSNPSTSNVAYDSPLTWIPPPK
jgi:hypothetical protein